MATSPGPSCPAPFPARGPHPGGLVWEGVPGALTLIKGYKSHLSSARNVASLSKACSAHCEPAITACSGLLPPRYWVF